MSANPGRYAGRPKGPMAWQATVGSLIKSGAIVHAYCGSCDLWERADLEKTKAAKGEDYSLWCKSTKCKCGSRVRFHASLGPGTPSRPLWD